ncbi:hypothetical protein [Paraliomyxa miuraensis]|uniref:hypothetical protein n=1 Tax=Paraliomyxa miuraensis TaxID=376150 RepID=UPI0022598BE3|nr:hypothetical protein [Paraliomyxa miuraensis]MCX4242190.1 hypothetical protein [Paraliomyxa miuraensis]
MPRLVPQLPSAILLGMLLCACDEGKGSDPTASASEEAKAEETKTSETKTSETKTGETKTGETKTGETKTDAVQAKLDAASEQIRKATGFTKDDYSDKKACETATPRMVSGLFGVPEGELKQMRMMGCIYSWKNADRSEMFEARFGSIRVHETEDAAKTWFGNATKGMSAEEVAEVMGKAKAKMKEDGNLDTKPKEQAAEHIGGALTDLAGKEGFQYDELSGPGDEAALGRSDGIIWIRKGNMTFNVSAYKGVPQPPPTITVGADPKKMIAMATEAQKKFIAETLEQRKADATKLANAILETM